MQPNDYYGKAYELATQGIDWNSSAKEKVKTVLLNVIHEGAWKAKKELLPVWPTQIHWPAAEAYLHEKNKPLKADHFAEELRLLTSRIAMRLNRIDQIQDLYQSEVSRRRRGYVYVGTFDLDSPTECGITGCHVIAAEHFMQNSLQPCILVGCQCEIGTFSEKDIKKQQKYVTNYLK